MISADLRKQVLIAVGTCVITIATLVFASFIESTIATSVRSFFDTPVQFETVPEAKPEAPPQPETNPANKKQPTPSAKAETAEPTVRPSPEQRTDTQSESKMGALLALSVVTHFFHVVKILLWFGLILIILRFLNKLIFGTALRQAASHELAGLIRTIINILILIVSFFIIFKTQYPTVDLGAIFTTSTIIGVVIGLALQDTLGNLFAGFAIQADQPFQTGDVVRFQNSGTGVVEAISWRGVKIRTFQNKLLIISNTVLGKEFIEVAPRDNLNARLVFFSTLYSDSPAHTIEVVRDVVRQTENVSSKFRPQVRIRDFGANGIDWEIKYWLEDYSKYNTTDALVRQNVWYACQREKIGFPYPTRTLYMQSENEPSAFTEDADEKFERLANLAIFSPLSEEEIRALANAGSVRVFAPNESIVRQGRKGKSMFVVHRGSVTVRIREGGEAHTIGTLHPGDFFGEMALFTGAERTADVIAEAETQVLEIKHTDLKPILESNPELVQSLSEIIEQRRSELDQQPAATEKSKKASKTGIVNSIRKFFGLKN